MPTLQAMIVDWSRGRISDADFIRYHRKLQKTRSCPHDPREGGLWADHPLVVQLRDMGVLSPAAAIYVTRLMYFGTMPPRRP